MTFFNVPGSWRSGGFLYGAESILKSGGLLEKFFKLRAAIRIVGRVHRLINAHFNVSTSIETILVTNRVVPQELHDFNGTKWAHGVHVDNCEMNYLEYTFNRTCRLNPSTQARHFTAILYVNECLGANFHFIDYPPGFSLEQSMKMFQECKNMMKASYRCFDAPGTCCYGHANHTIIVPSPGKLIIFSSGTENVHGVTPLISGPRYTVSMWFTRK